MTITEVDAGKKHQKNKNKNKKPNKSLVILRVLFALLTLQNFS